MCGICGIVSREAAVDRCIAQRMQQALYHRGPDDGGDFSADHIALAFRRLSIIDLAGGWQPFVSEDKKVTLFGSGQIYNAVELRDELQKKGHHFRSRSDIETIIHLYEDHGMKCLEYLRGMFAIAIWDARSQRLILARDRLGEKPIYFYLKNQTLIFASELKGLLASGLVPFELDPVSIDLYFHYHYIPEPRTALKAVHKVSAGHFLTVDVADWEITEHCYWRLENSPVIEGDPIDRIREELDEVGKIIVRSDVPIGVALSAGIDSSVIAALAVKNCPETIQAFTVGYSGRPHHDERQEARDLADLLKIPFHEIELSTSDYISFFPTLNHHRDDPIADISGFGYYSVMKLASDHGIHVMMQGQGGDELFWGYPWLREAANESLLKQMFYQRDSSAFRDYMRFRIPGELPFGLTANWRRYRSHKSAPANQLVFYDIVPHFKYALKKAARMYTGQFKESLGASSPLDIFTINQPWSNVEILMTRLIHETYLLENGIAQGDRLSMASSVELRLPLLDYRFVETIVGLRKAHSDLGLQPKAWFKQATLDLLPAEVLKRPKRGFQPPVHEWVPGIFKAYGNLLENGYLVQSGVIRKEAAAELAKGEYTSNALCYPALVLEVWARKFSSLT